MTYTVSEKLHNSKKLIQHTVLEDGKTLCGPSFSSDFTVEDTPEYTEGWEARSAKKSESSNPYSGRAGSLWSMGWSDADNDPALRSEEMK